LTLHSKSSRGDDVVVDVEENEEETMVEIDGVQGGAYEVRFNPDEN
jgi:hypothetical protein